ncbi:MAG: hypothetical protein AB1540_07435 [Bdellovibrionota bacterium]
MKKSSRSQITKGFFQSGILGTAFFLSLGSVQLAFSDSDPNQLLSFKKIYIEPVQDNVDGTFNEPVAQSYREVFDRNQRFELVNSKEEANATVQTKIDKKATGIDLEISLFIPSTGETFSTDRATVPAGTEGKETGITVKGLLKTVLKRIPFYGTVTGREGTELTFDIGSAHGLRPGDIVQISRIDQIKRHPLLKAIVDVQLVAVGNAAIEQTEDTISFGRVYTEITGEQIRKFYKVTAIEGHLPDEKKASPQDPGLLEANEKDDQDKPHIGFLGLGVLMSSFASSTSQSSTQVGGARTFSGSAFNPGFQLNGEVWLTKNWFVDLLFGASTMSFRQIDTSIEPAPQGTGVGSSNRAFSINAGYKYLPTGSIYGPQVYLKLGYYNFSFGTTAEAASLLSSKTYSALNLGIGGSLPVERSNKWGVLLNLNVLLFPSLEEDAAFRSGTNSSASGVNFFVGGYHYLSNRLSVRAGFQFDSYSADFEEGSSTNQRVIGFMPSVLYHF